jgi:hypothetical protein
VDVNDTRREVRKGPSSSNTFQLSDSHSVVPPARSTHAHSRGVLRTTRIKPLPDRTGQGRRSPLASLHSYRLPGHRPIKEVYALSGAWWRGRASTPHTLRTRPRMLYKYTISCAQYNVRMYDVCHLHVILADGSSCTSHSSSLWYGPGQQAADLVEAPYRALVAPERLRGIGHPLRLWFVPGHVRLALPHHSTENANQNAPAALGEPL